MREARSKTRRAGILALLAAALAGCDIAPGARVGDPQPRGEDTTLAAKGSIPTPTFVPVQSTQPLQFESGGSPPAAVSTPASAAAGAASPPAPSAALSIPVPAPVLPAPTIPVPAPVLPAPSTLVGGALSIRLDDADWFGGWKQSKTYGGRSATWIYGSGTEYSAMQAQFELAGQPAGDGVLSIEGMDGENTPKMDITIQVNGVAIYTGPNPLPDDDHVLETGTWATYSWLVDASLLQPGINRITIVALSEGGFGQPPFMMLDYADLVIDG